MMACGLACAAAPPLCNAKLTASASPAPSATHTRTMKPLFINSPVGPIAQTVPLSRYGASTRRP